MGTRENEKLKFINRELKKKGNFQKYGMLKSARTFFAEEASDVQKRKVKKAEEKAKKKYESDRSAARSARRMREKGAD